MRKRVLLTIVAALGLGCAVFALTPSGRSAFKGSLSGVPKEPLYKYSYTSIDGKLVNMSDYKGKKILFVNVASQCGHTPQYEALQALQTKFRDKLIIIGFPCNQFGAQEPGTETDIKDFCKKNYGVTFPLSSKVDVKGSGQHAIYKWLTDASLNGVETSEVKWNFQKYLVDESGNYIAMFAPKVKPDDPSIAEAIQK